MEKKQIVLSELPVAPEVRPIDKLYDLKSIVTDMLTTERANEKPDDYVNFDPQKNITFIDYLEREVGTDISQIIAERFQQKTKQEIKFMLKRDKKHVNDPYRKPELKEDGNGNSLQMEYESVWNGIKDRFINGLYTNDEMKTQIKALYKAYWYGKEVNVNNPILEVNENMEAKGNQKKPILLSMSELPIFDGLK